MACNDIGNSRPVEADACLKFCVRLSAVDGCFDWDTTEFFNCTMDMRDPNYGKYPDWNLYMDTYEFSHDLYQSSAIDSDLDNDKFAAYLTEVIFPRGDGSPTGEVSTATRVGYRR